LAHGGNVLEIGLEEAGCDPPGVIKYPALFGIAARGLKKYVWNPKTQHCRVFPK
jgi:hypothetical protein